MALRNINLVFGEYYHIYNRGNSKQDIFLDEQDYDRFEKLLYVCNSEFKFNFRESVVRNEINAFDFERGESLVSILGWVLMPNHFHIILISKDLPRSHLGKKIEYNNISEFMRKLSTAYVMYFNKKYERTGTLFEGPFKSKHIGQENYFNYIFSYVHLNPIKLIQKDWKENDISNKNETINFLKNYKHSSFIDYFDNRGKERRQGKIINKNLIPEYFRINHVRDLFKWIKENSA